MKEHHINSFGYYIRQLRESAKLSIKMVAKQLDIDPSLLGKIERNERQPSKDFIVSIAKILNQDASMLHKEFISDQIAYKILEADGDIETLKIAEKKIQYLKAKKIIE